MAALDSEYMSGFFSCRYLKNTTRFPEPNAYDENIFVGDD